MERISSSRNTFSSSHEENTRFIGGGGVGGVVGFDADEVEGAGICLVGD